jgi:hypothetical protein
VFCIFFCFFFCSCLQCAHCVALFQEHLAQIPAAELERVRQSMMKVALYQEKVDRMQQSMTRISSDVAALHKEALDLDKHQGPGSETPRSPRKAGKI